MVSWAEGADVWIISASSSISYDTQSTTNAKISGMSAGGASGRSLGNLELLILANYFKSTVGDTNSSLYEIVGGLNFVVFGKHSDALYISGRFGTQNSKSSTTATSTSTSAMLFGLEEPWGSDSR